MRWSHSHGHNFINWTESNNKKKNSYTVIVYSCVVLNHCMFYMKKPEAKIMAERESPNLYIQAGHLPFANDQNLTANMLKGRWAVTLLCLWCCFCLWNLYWDQTVKTETGKPTNSNWERESERVRAYPVVYCHVDRVLFKIQFQFG